MRDQSSVEAILGTQINCALLAVNLWEGPLQLTDALVAAWTRTLGKMEAFAIAKRHRIPLAPVRDVDEVMRDHHMIYCRKVWHLAAAQP